MSRRAIVLLAFTAVLALPAAARAGDRALPMVLPGAATVSTAPAERSSWIVGARPGRPAAVLARRFGARHTGVTGTGGYVVARNHARAFAAALRAHGLLVYAQPHTLARPRAVADDPLSGPPNDWRAKVAERELDPPPVTPTSPLIALVDAAAEATHPEWTGDPNFRTLGGPPVTETHGTATAAIAAAPANGIGILGVWPGARALNVPLAGELISCQASADAIAEAVRQGAAVINLSYGSRALCMPEYVALQYAVGQGVIPVAAAGNEFAEGNPLEFPASLPHVLTVAATDDRDRAAYFSSASAAVDLSAPGVGILTAVPPGLDNDGVQDGYAAVSGTSFAAPMVSAAVAWVRAARPRLAPDQVAQVVRRSAHDIRPKGWDPNTGYGILDVKAALRRRPPRHDPLEPNDNLVWVNGRAFARRDPAIWTGGKPRRLRASVDRYEDPADVYRIIIPAHATARISAVPTLGDIDLGVYARNATALTDTGHRLAYSHKHGRATERLSVRNASPNPRSFYLAIRPQGTRSLDAAYTLRIRR